MDNVVTLVKFFCLQGNTENRETKITPEMHFYKKKKLTERKTNS